MFFCNHMFLEMHEISPQLFQRRTWFRLCLTLKNMDNCTEKTAELCCTANLRRQRPQGNRRRGNRSGCIGRSLHRGGGKGIAIPRTILFSFAQNQEVEEDFHFAPFHPYLFQKDQEESWLTWDLASAASALVQTYPEQVAYGQEQDRNLTGQTASVVFQWAEEHQVKDVFDQDQKVDPVFPNVL